MDYIERKISGKKYRYARKSARLPDGRVLSLQKIDKGESKQELERIFEEKEKQAFIKFTLSRFKHDHIITKKEFEKIEEIRLNYKKILRK